MKKLSTQASVPKMLDFFIMPSTYLIVLEKPNRCQELYTYLLDLPSIPSETVGKRLMCQMVDSVIGVLDAGVVHGDLKFDNFLVDPVSLQVWLIDFGCGYLHTSDYSSSYSGPTCYCPPEFLFDGRYSIECAIVWNLGILLYELFNEDVPFVTADEVKYGELKVACCHSSQLKELIFSCLDRDPKKRITLSYLQASAWLSYC